MTQAAGIVGSSPASSPVVMLRRFFARSFAGITWRKVGAFVVFCAIFGTVLNTGPRELVPASVAQYLSRFAAALELFAPMFFALAVAANFAPRPSVPRALVLSAAVVFGTAIGYWLMVGTETVVSRWHDERLRLFTEPVWYVLVGWLGLVLVLLDERDTAAAQAAYAEVERRADLTRQMSQSQLQVLQSQIEPHFLFNTLAHIRRLYQTDPCSGRATLRHLGEYFSAALPAMREDGIRLGQDLALAHAYLNIQKIRMGPRLVFELDVPVDLEHVRIPPMTLTTLVENAINHGLMPLPDGGTIRVDVRRERESLHIRVADTGRGFQDTLGTGVGLANIRGRLAMLYGPDAYVSLAHNQPQGVVVTITIPLSTQPR